jgi:hypothetical protein
VIVAACNVEDGAGIAAHAAAADSAAPQRACATAPTPALPPPPRNLRLDPDAVAMVDASGARRTSPVFNASTVNAVPSMRTSSDGRLGVGVKVGTDEVAANNAVQLFLLRPESTVTTGVGMDPVGYTIQLSSVPKPRWTSTRFPPGVRGAMRQITMCSSAITSTGSTDIYDLTLLGIMDDENGKSAQTYLMSVTVNVGNAKQPSATLAKVTVNEVHRGANFEVPTLLEPMVTDDGKLLVGRLGNVPLAEWTGSSRYNIVYAYIASGLCTNAALDALPQMPFKPILNAPFDGELAGYGFRARPIRDAAGTLITTTGGSSTPDLSGSYPWIDRSGRNLFFTSIASKNQGSAKLRFASSSCVAGSTCFDDEYGDQTRGVAMVGSWTNGKIVLLDGPINNIDFGAGVTGAGAPRALQQMIPLYAGTPPVRFASGRENGVTTLGPTVDNMTIIDALENLPNGTATWVPRTRREVVWKVSRGHISDEVAFDDFVDPNVFLYAPMNAVIDNARGRYYDGYDQTDPQCQSGTGDYVGAAQVRLQNAATRPSGMGQLPAFGTISDPTNSVRVEPAALGGIHGRGLYLPAGAALSFPLDNPATGCTPVDACTDASSRTNSWYLGQFVDTGTTTPFTLWSISGRFSVGLSSTEVTITPQGGQPIRVARNGMMKRWTHLAVLYSAASNRSTPGDSKLHVYLDGELLDSVLVPAASRPLFNPDWSASTLSVSAPPTGSTGIWVDELKIVLNAEGMTANHELTCNHAMGSIYATASRERCVPYYDGSTPSGTSKRSDYIGMTTNGVSNLHYNAPRPPSFASNAFCMTCHVDGGPGGTDVKRPLALRDQALAFRQAPPFDMAKTDPRRQPMLPPRWLTGNVPAGFYGAGLPGSARNCPTDVADDCNVDTYLLPP